MKKNPNTPIQVTGGGSGTGISALINGTTDICQSSRAMKPAEKSKLRDRYNTTGVEIPVARDGLAVYVHASNPLDRDHDGAAEGHLHRQDHQLEGRRRPGRQASSSTPARTARAPTCSSRSTCSQGRDFTPRAQTMPGTASVVNAVSKEKFGIGYGGAAYAKGIKILKVKKDAGQPRHRPRPEDRHRRQLPAGPAAVLLPAQQAQRRHQDLRRLRAVRRGPGGRRQGRLLPDQVVAATSDRRQGRSRLRGRLSSTCNKCATERSLPSWFTAGRVLDRPDVASEAGPEAAAPLAWAAERVLQVAAFAAVAAIVLIFVFVAKEALPLFYDHEVRSEVTLSQMWFAQQWRGLRPARAHLAAGLRRPQVRASGR